LPDPFPCEGGSVGVLVLKTPVKAGCLAAVKTAQEGGEPKPAALRSELLRSVFLIFWGKRMNFPSTGKAIRSALYPLPLLVGQAAPILVKYDFLLLPSRTTKISNAGLLFVVIFSFIYSGVIAGFMRERKPGYFAAHQDENSGSAANGAGNEFAGCSKMFWYAQMNKSRP
jgi:hypothetical protein